MKWNKGKQKKIKDNSIHHGYLGFDRTRQNNEYGGKHFCMTCLKLADSCGCSYEKRNWINVPIHTRIPRKDASKNTWKRFFRLFITDSKSE